MRGYRWVVAMVVVLVSLAGCAVQNPNSLGSVAGRAVSADHVEELNAAVARILQASPAETRSAVATAVLRAELARAAAPLRSVTIDPAQRASVILTDQALQAFAADPVASEVAADVADTVLFYTAIGGPDKFAAAVADVPVRVNPRYGTWDGSRAVIASSGSLSLPYASTSAVPTASAEPSPSTTPSR